MWLPKCLYKNTSLLAAEMCFIYYLCTTIAKIVAKRSTVMIKTIFKNTDKINNSNTILNISTTSFFKVGWQPHFCTLYLQ